MVSTQLPRGGNLGCLTAFPPRVQEGWPTATPPFAAAWMAPPVTPCPSQTHTCAPGSPRSGPHLHSSNSAPRPQPCQPHLEHLLHPLPGQVHVQLVQQLQDLSDAQAAVAVLVGLVKRLLQPLWGQVRGQRGSSRASPLPSPASRAGTAGGGLPPQRPSPNMGASPGGQLHPRILVAGALAAGQAVLVADAGHEVAQARDPGACLVPAGRDQVQRLAVAAVVDAEAAVGVKAALWVALEDLGLAPLAHLMDGVNGDCRGSGRGGGMVTAPPGPGAPPQPRGALSHSLGRGRFKGPSGWEGKTQMPYLLRLVSPSPLCSDPGLLPLPLGTPHQSEPPDPRACPAHPLHP